MRGKHHCLINDDDEEEGDANVHMYPADMYPDEQDEYREAVHTSKASELNRDQVAGFMRGKRKIGKSGPLRGVVSKGSTASSSLSSKAGRADDCDCYC